MPLLLGTPPELIMPELLGTPPEFAASIPELADCADELAEFWMFNPIALALPPP
jgi:hypothetical protein